MNYEQKYFKIVIYSKIFISCSGVQTAIFSGTLVIINQLVSQDGLTINQNIAEGVGFVWNI